MPVAYEQGLVSVIIPTYNRAGFVGEAIDSVWDQTYRPIELLVVDDGSSDNTAQATRAKFAALPDDLGFRAHHIRQPNRGASSARNQGLLHSHGEFIQYLDSDDVLIRHKLARHVAALRRNEALDLIWSDWLVTPSEVLRARLAESNTAAMTEGAPVCEPTDRIIPWEPWPLLARRRFVAAHPLWNELTSRWDDWEYALRLLAAKPSKAFVAGICCIQRQHSLGRREDYDFNSEGVERGLIACREAAKVCTRLASLDVRIRQLIGVRYWEVGLEALLHGTDDQAVEAFRCAASMGTRMLFRLKGFGAWLALKLAGRRATKLLLARYFAHKRQASKAAS
jgi:glycosyltransferase involved in cell wall biosynthesis